MTNKIGYKVILIRYSYDTINDIVNRLKYPVDSFVSIKNELSY